MQHIRHECDSSSCNEMAFYEVCADKLSSIAKNYVYNPISSTKLKRHCYVYNKNKESISLLRNMQFLIKELSIQHRAHRNSTCSSIKSGVTSVNFGIRPNYQNLFLVCSRTTRHKTLLGAMTVRTLPTLGRNSASRILVPQGVVLC